MDVDFFGPSLLRNWACSKKMSVLTVQNVVESVAICLPEESLVLAGDSLIERDEDLSSVPVEKVLWGELKVPAKVAIIRIQRDDAIGIKIVTLASVAVVIRTWVANRPIEQVQFRVERPGQPCGAATSFQGVRFPRL